MDNGSLAAISVNIRNFLPTFWLSLCLIARSSHRYGYSLNCRSHISGWRLFWRRQWSSHWLQLYWQRVAPFRVQSGHCGGSQLSPWQGCCSEMSRWGTVLPISTYIKLDEYNFNILFMQLPPTMRSPSQQIHPRAQFPLVPLWFFNVTLIHQHQREQPTPGVAPF